MTKKVEARLRLEPAGRQLLAAPGKPLADLLFDEGVEFPCGGRGRCGGCRIRIREGTLPISPADRQFFGPEELASGWRLACRGAVNGDLVIDLAQWEAPVLVDDSKVPFAPRPGLGVVVDIGTTTLAAQLLDLKTGRVLGVRTALNSQARHGADLMSRLDFAVNGGGGEILQQSIRTQVGEMTTGLVRDAGRGPSDLHDVVLVGNTVMHHLFCGEEVASLAVYPFDSDQGGLKVIVGRDMGWEGLPDVRARFLTSLGGFVGSDVLAGVLATGLGESGSLRALVDLGTNGEIVVGNRDGLLCASTAAGPAFEGARISCGMRAVTGAISSVKVQGGGVVCQVVGSGQGRGVCGSGLVDAVACGLELGWVRPNGRLDRGANLPLTQSVKLSQCDVRELQLAKGAVAAGLRLLAERLGAGLEDLEQVYLAGAFGNYVHRLSAERIGLLGVPAEKVVAVGNTALRGAKIALFGLPQEEGDYAALRARIEHVALNEDPRFLDTYAEAMLFPEKAIP